LRNIDLQHSQRLEGELQVPNRAAEDDVFGALDGGGRFGFQLRFIFQAAERDGNFGECDGAAEKFLRFSGAGGTTVSTPGANWRGGTAIWAESLGLASEAIASAARARRFGIRPMLGGCARLGKTR
jgi:hypothetical protein